MKIAELEPRRARANSQRSLRRVAALAALGASLLACSAEQGSPAIPPQAVTARPEGAPRWGNFALEGTAVLARGDERGTSLRVLYSDRLKDGRIPGSWLESQSLSLVESRKANKVCLRELYKSWEQGDIFGLESVDGPGAFVELSFNDGQGAWRVRRPAGALGADFERHCAAFEAAYAGASPDSGGDDSSPASRPAAGR